MKIGEFEYKILIEVEFTKQELEIIEACAIYHYDGRVKDMVCRGGFFYGWIRIRMGEGDKRITCSPDQLDTCSKAIEMPTDINESEATLKARCDLQMVLRNLLRDMGAEWERINKDGEGDALRQLVAMYQGEGDKSELPEETEYKTLAKICEGKRTGEQTKRLRELANLIGEL